MSRTHTVGQDWSSVSDILLACGVGILYSFAKVVPEAEIFVNELQHWILSFFSLTLATNIICTGESPFPALEEKSYRRATSLRPRCAPHLAD